MKINNNLLKKIVPMDLALLPVIFLVIYCLPTATLDTTFKVTILYFFPLLLGSSVVSSLYYGKKEIPSDFYIKYFKSLSLHGFVSILFFSLAAVLLKCSSSKSIESKLAMLSIVLIILTSGMAVTSVVERKKYLKTSMVIGFFVIFIVLLFDYKLSRFNQLDYWIIAN